MNNWFVYALGFIAQLLFSARLLLQWFASEKNKKITTPAAFWIQSLAASFLLFVYGYLRNDFSIMLGQMITYYIYIRNLQIRGEWKRMHISLRLFLSLFPLLLIIYFYNNNKYDLYNLFRNNNIPNWLMVLGTVAQVVFTFRFILQWLYSEKIKESVLPLRFWVVSLIGSAMILTYAIFRRDPILFAGQLFGFIVYTRNIMIFRKARQHKASLP